jgi:hypothetical protein
MTLNCVVVDDSAIQRLSIVKLIENHPSLNLNCGVQQRFRDKKRPEYPQG